MYQRHGEEQDHSGESQNRATPLHERRYILMDASWLWCFVLVWLGDTPGQMRDMLMSHSLLGDISVSPSQKPLVSSATLTWINRWKCTDGVFLAAVMVKHLNTQVFSQFKACMYVCTDVQIWLINHLADWWLQWCWAVGQMPPQFRCWWVSRWQVETWMRVSEHPG